MKNKLPVHKNQPLVDFTSVVMEHRPELKYFPRVLLYYIKFLAFEPFRLWESFTRGKEIEGHRFPKDPVFILGYYRSGTTYLQEILLEDKQYGYLNFYQCFFSNGFLASESLFKKIFQRIVSFVNFHHPAHRIPFYFHMPGEEDVAMVSSGYKWSSNWGQLFPQKFKHFFNKTVFFEGTSLAEKESFAQEMRQLFARASIASGGKQLLLKSPPQTGRLGFLKAQFPNAKFIFIRRDLYFTYKSNQKLWKSFHDVCLRDFTPEEADENILWSMDKCYEVLQKEKALMGENQFIEISYEELLENPIMTLDKVYETLEIPGFDKARPAFEAYAQKHHGNNRAKHGCSEKDMDKVEKRLEKWLTLWGYKRPTGN